MTIRSEANKPQERKKFISIYWKCCNVYSRVYRNAKKTAYEGQCPKCHGSLSVPIGEGGTAQRSFIAE